MTSGRWQQAFADYAFRPPTAWMKAFLVVGAIALPAGVWERRGAVVGVLALLVLGGFLIGIAFSQDRMLAWMDRHPVLGVPVLLGTVFFALAHLGPLSLAACAALTLPLGVVMVAGEIRRRRAAPTS